MKALVDVNLSPAWAAVLAAHRIEAVHWTSVGDPRAADAELMGYARDHGCDLLRCAERAPQSLYS